MRTNKIHEYAAKQIAERNSRAVCVQRRGHDLRSIGQMCNRTNGRVVDVNRTRRRPSNNPDKRREAT
jgi:acetolactate synthase small subunit